MPVKCQRCGAENPASARFCMSCGNALPAAADAPAAPAGAAAPQEAGEAVATAPELAAAEPPRAVPLPAQFSRRPVDPGELPPTHPEWKMSSAGPLPDPPKRRIWLWVLGGIGAVILLCIVLSIVSSLALGPAVEGQ